MEYILLISFVFILGTIIGSFLNVVSLRFNTGFSLGGRSKCFSCGKTLSWRELFPLLSFILQKGKCSNCKSKISWQYPLVEAVTGIVFALIFYKVFSFSDPFSVTAIIMAYFFAVFSILIVIAIYDLKHKIIPDEFVYVFILLSFLSAVVSVLLSPYPMNYELYLELLSGPVIFLPFFLLWFLSRGTWMGLGDAKLALGMGWFLGISKGFGALFVAFYIGAIVGLSVIIFQELSKMGWLGSKRLSLNGKNFTMKSEIPFGPFLIFGLMAVFFFNINFFGM